MTKTWTIRLNDDDRRLLDQCAAAKGRDKSALFRDLIRQYHALLTQRGEIKG